MYFNIPIFTYHRVCNQSNTTGATSRTSSALPPRSHTFTQVFSEVRVNQSFILCLVFFSSLHVLSSFLFWPIYRVYFFIPVIMYDKDIPWQYIMLRTWWICLLRKCWNIAYRWNVASKEIFTAGWYLIGLWIRRHLEEGRLRSLIINKLF
jgi:hypothetical protein